MECSPTCTETQVLLPGAELGFFNVPGNSRLQPQDQACELEYLHGRIPAGTCITKGCSHGRVSFSSETRHKLLGLSWSGGHFVVVESFSSVCLFATPWTAAHQASMSFTISRSLLKLMFIESVMAYDRLILCHPLLLLPSVFCSIRIFSSEWVLRIRYPKYWSFGFSKVLPMNTQG